MESRFGNREAGWVWRDPVLGAVCTGDGISLRKPIATYGGGIVLVGDIQVPATAADADVNWFTSYPDLPNPTIHLPLIEYANPADTGKKLHGKGNLYVTDFDILTGTTVCGATSPTGPATLHIELGARGGGLLMLDAVFNHVSGAGGSFKNFQPATWKPAPVLLGTDVGPDELGLRVRPAAAPFAAGRWRFVVHCFEV